MNRCLVLLLMPFILIWHLPAQTFVVHADDHKADGAVSPFNAVKAGDTVWIAAGPRNELRLDNFHGLPGKPVVFANLGGQVVISSAMSYGISIGNSTYFKLTGRPGKQGGYGFKVSSVPSEAGIGISADRKSSDLEIEFCEITGTGFAGIQSRTNPDCNDPTTLRGGFVQRNTSVHDCYIHHVAGEGIYLGNSAFTGIRPAGCSAVVLPSVMEGVRVYNNRIESTGLDGIQVSSAVGDCMIHHNLLLDCSYLMMPNQRSGILIGGGTLAKCFSNTILDPWATGILVFGNGGTEVYNNLIVRPAKRFNPGSQTEPESGIFLADKTGADHTFYGIYGNTIIQPKSDGIRIDNSVDFEVRIYNNAIVDPGAYAWYENDNTGRTGYDSYIFDGGERHLYKAAGNYFGRRLADCGFENAAGDDYHLLAGSPLVDIGIDPGPALLVEDLDGNPRPGGLKYDAGAYEYQPSESSATPSSPNDFEFLAAFAGSDGLKIRLASARNLTLSMSVTDLSGRVLYRKSDVFTAPGISVLSVPVTAPGMYIFAIQTDHFIHAGKVILFQAR